MISKAQTQVELVLRDGVNDYTVALRDRLQAIYSSHSANGRLQSGATVKEAVRAMNELACEAVDRFSSKVIPIARDSEAGAALRLAVLDLIEFYRDEMPTIVRMASGRMSCEPNSSIETAAYALFDEMESKVETKLEIAEFNFTDKPNAIDRDARATKQLKTGRPPAAFWDDMWASIASDLYAGTLSPRTQAEVEQVMLKWIEDHGYSAATSTVRARARRLWDQIQSSD